MKTFVEVKEFILATCPLITEEQVDAFEKFLDNLDLSRYPTVFERIPEASSIKGLYLERISEAIDKGDTHQILDDTSVARELVIEAFVWDDYDLWDVVDDEWKISIV